MTRALVRFAVIVVCLALAACAGLLGIKPKTAGMQPFEHRAHVLKGVSCLECHSGIASAGDLGPLHVPETATCTKCHEKPHDTRDCNGCHGSVHTRQRAELAREHLRFEHRGHVLAANGECVRCHVAAGESRPESMLPPMAACLGCHHHEKQFVVRDCEGCHVDLPAEHIKPESHVVHEGDFVREHGVRAASARDLCSTCHSERFCSSCHGVSTPALPARLAFDKPALGGLHRAGFFSRHKEEARGQPGLCTTCHSEDSCRACHSRENVGATGRPGRGPHPRTWLTAGKGGGDHGMSARIDPASCASCHGGAGEMLCVSCHKVGGVGGNIHGPGFSSIKSKTRDVPCRLCHVPNP